VESAAAFAVISYPGLLRAGWSAWLRCYQLLAFFAGLRHEPSGPPSARPAA
jgi:hypothetical protein